MTRRVFCLLALAGLAAAWDSEAAPARVHRVAIRGMVFQPAVLQVAPGDVVVWSNEDVVPHTVTSEDRGLDSGQIDPGKSWRATLGSAGDLAYVCLYHPGMKGRVKVR